MSEVVPQFIIVSDLFTPQPWSSPSFFICCCSSFAKSRYTLRKVLMMDYVDWASWCKAWLRWRAIGDMDDLPTSSVPWHRVSFFSESSKMMLYLNNSRIINSISLLTSSSCAASKSTASLLHDLRSACLKLSQFQWHNDPSILSLFNREISFVAIPVHRMQSSPKASFSSDDSAWSRALKGRF